MGKSKENKTKVKTIKSNLIYPENLETKFANQIIVQSQPDYFILSFFEAMLPPIYGETEEERKAQFEKIKAIDSKCVGKFVITPQKINELVDILKAQVKNYNELKESKSE